MIYAHLTWSLNIYSNQVSFNFDWNDSYRIDYLDSSFSWTIPVTHMNQQMDKWVIRPTDAP